MPTKRKRPPVDEWMWKIFVEACGSRCGACGEDVPLERGHRIPHAIGGVDSYDNLIPVCKGCNKKYLKKETPDNYRPDDYLERFYLLLGAALRPQISVHTANGLSRIMVGTEPTQNTQVIAWQTPQNAAGTEVFTKPSNLTHSEAKTLVENLVYDARQNYEPRPHLPYPAHRTELIRLAMKDGAAFRVAADAFLRDRAWIAEDDKVLFDSWGPLANDFTHFLRLGRETLRRERAAELANAEQVKRQAEARQQVAAEPPQPEMDAVSKECLTTIAWITDNLEAVTRADKALIVRDVATMRDKINSGTLDASTLRRYRDWLNIKASSIRRAAADALQSA